MKENSDFIFGTRAIMEAIHANRDIDKVLIQQGLNNELIKDLQEMVKENGIPLVKVPIHKLNRVTRKNHQGAICFLSAVTYASLENVISQCYESGNSPLIVVLDRVTDVRNFGAIARTAECFGAQAIVIPDRGSAQINSDAMKTSAGALNHIPVCRAENLRKTLEYLQQNGLQLVACTEKGADSIFDTDLTGPVALILGSEENGIQTDFLKIADSLAQIPMSGKISSLNVSVSAAVCLAEAVRQRL